MPLALIGIGTVFLITAVRGTSNDLLALLKSDFTGSNNFLFWIVAIGIVGSLGYIDELEPVSDGFLALIIIVILLSNKGFFSQFQSQLNQASST